MLICELEEAVQALMKRKPRMVPPPNKLDSRDPRILAHRVKHAATKRPIRGA